MFHFVKVRRVTLNNYCGYSDTTFDFSDGGAGIKPFSTFFGPNGIGKTTCMHAIRLAANPATFRGRERESALMLRKSIFDEDYVPSVDMMSDKIKSRMNIVVEFVTDQGIKIVHIDNDGIVRNDLGYEDVPMNGYTYFADADNPINTSKFLLAFEQAEKFVAFAEEVYGYRCELGMPISAGGIRGYTDFFIKKGKVKVHFKSMSAGEKKIATLVSDLCQPINTVRRDIILIDNVEMHVYFKRHTKMIDKLMEIFPEKQIITSTHSSIVIGHVNPQYHFDLELYRPEYKLFDSKVSFDSIKLESPVVQDFGFHGQQQKLSPPASGLDVLIEKFKNKGTSVNQQKLKVSDIITKIMGGGE
jgi:hypothetical protein